MEETGSEDCHGRALWALGVTEAWSKVSGHADVAAELLLDDDQQTTIYDLTGPALLTMTDVARILTETSGTPVRFENETLEEAYASRAQFEATQFEKEAWVTSYSAIAAGELEVVSDGVARVLGRPPKSLAEVLGARR